MYSTRSAKFLAALTCRFFLIIWLELSLLRPYIQLLAHESPNFVCNTLFNTLTRIDVNKNGVCDIGQFFSIVVGQISWEILVSFRYQS